MKKRIAMLLTACALTGMTLAGCGSKEESTSNAESLSSLKLEDCVTLGEYKGVEVTVAPVSVTDEQVSSMIEYYASSALQEENLIEEGTIAEGDTARIDYTGYDNGVAFDGGTATDYDLTIGSGTFIPGFEDGLVGVGVGETVNLDLTFPEDYTNAEMAGKEVTFEVTVKGIVETTTRELTDETAAEVAQSMNLEATDLASLNTAVYDSLLENAKNSQESEIRSKVTEIVYNNLTVTEVPEFMITRLYDRMDQSLTSYATAYGMDAATLASYQYGIDPESYTDYMTEMSTEYAAEYVAFQQIAVKEGLTVSDEEAKAQAETEYAMYGYENVDAFFEAVSLDEYRDDMMFDNVMNFLIENAVVVESEETAE